MKTDTQQQWNSTEKVISEGKLLSEILRYHISALSHSRAPTQDNRKSTHKVTQDLHTFAYSLWYPLIVLLPLSAPQTGQQSTTAVLCAVLLLIQALVSDLLLSIEYDE